MTSHNMKPPIAVLITSFLFVLFSVQYAASQTQESKPTTHFYLTRFSYTPETWARLMKNPEDRRIAARKYIESVGGKLHGFWYAFGAHDGYCLSEAPDNVSMAAVALAITGGGALSTFENHSPPHR